MREWLKSLDLIQFGILIVGYLFLQDYLIAKYTFNLDVGVFIENFLFHLKGWNFLAYMVFIPLFQILSIVYVIHFIQQKDFFPKRQSCSNRNFLKIVLAVFLSLVIALIDPIMDKFKDILPHYLSNLYYISLLLMTSFSLLMRIYRSIDIKKSMVAIYIILLFCLSTYFIGNDKTISNFLMLGVITVCFYSLYPKESNSNFSEWFAVIKNNLVVILILVSVYISYLNNKMWVSTFLNNHESIGMLNKEFLVENESNITINGDSDSLDHRDKVLKMILASDKDHEVYYLPISSEMRWYFIDRHKPDINNSKITIYGVEEKTSTSDPMKKVRNVTFRSYFDINISK